MIRVTDGTTLNQFSETIPRAATLGEDYLRMVASGVQEVEPPVTMSLDQMSSGGFRAQPIQCLVITPTERRLRHYRTAHYAKPTGGLLNVGWYLVGGDRAGGRDLGGTGFMVGGATGVDVDNVMSIVNVIQTYAVLPAIQRIADQALSGGQGNKGFFGT